jgi:hypothetical protein
VRFLIDEMFPPAVCALLTERGHDAVHVRDLGLDARPDAEVAIAAVREGHALVTENVKDFAAERDVVVVCVLKSRLGGRGMAVRLADLLDGWADRYPEPYVGLHWP